MILYVTRCSLNDREQRLFLVERKKNETNDFGIRLSETERIASGVGGSF